VQADILALPDNADWLAGRLKAVAATLMACFARQGETDEFAEEVAEALEAALAEHAAAPLRDWLAAHRAGMEVASVGTAPVLLRPQRRVNPAQL
jgi:hypothetical protein